MRSSQLRCCGSVLQVRRVRGHVTKAIELARTSGAEADRIGGSVEAEVRQ